MSVSFSVALRFPNSISAFVGIAFQCQLYLWDCKHNCSVSTTDLTVAVVQIAGRTGALLSKLVSKEDHGTNIHA